jgi:hypothetical protein
VTTTCRGTLGAAAALRGAEVFAPQSLGLMPCKPAQDPDSGLGQVIQACDCRLILPWALPDEDDLKCTSQQHDSATTDIVNCVRD